jgi:simple sugar transport system ATP-binding protein
VNTKGQSNRQLAEMMIGTKVKDVARQKAPAKGKILFAVNNLDRPKQNAFSVTLHDISIEARAGEIFGIAGIAGNGQDELMAALTGEWLGDKSGVITLDGGDISSQGPAERRLAGMGFIPEERNGHAAVPSMSLADNALLTNHSLAGVVRGGVLDLAGMRAKAEAIATNFDVRLPEPNPLASSLSGGNLQKFVVGREIIKVPRVLIVSQPTWGVDIGAAVFIRTAMLDLVAKGSAVVMISQDLEEIFAISHRIAVLHDGVLSPAESAAKLTAERVGLLMGGSDAVQDIGQGASA